MYGLCNLQLIPGLVFLALRVTCLCSITPPLKVSRQERLSLVSYREKSLRKELEFSRTARCVMQRRRSSARV
jgi:hypothetical protein